MKTLLKFKQTEVYQLMTEAQWKPSFIGMMQEQQINAFYSSAILAMLRSTTLDQGAPTF